ncbi:DUF418 domain-containing protein [Staphylococcus sp. 11261D007BR]
MKRIHTADALRGFSLFGIFLANLLIFQYGLTGQDYLEYMNIGPFSEGLAVVIKVLIVHSFMPIFGILFGFSIDKLYQSMKNKDVKAKRFKLFLRAIGLLILGSLHANYIWEGDILSTYSIGMFILIIFIGFRTAFFKWCLWIILAFAIFSGVMGGMDQSSFMEVDDHKMKDYLHQTTSIYQHGDYNDIHTKLPEIEDPTFETLGLSKGETAVFMLLIMPYTTLPLFIIGVYISRTNWLSKGTSQFWRYRLWLILIPISMMVKLMTILFPNVSWFTSFSMIFDVTLAIGYMVLFKLLYERFQSSAVMRGFQSMGKMSLTMYITQSVFGTLIFYGYGLQWFNTNRLWLAVPMFILFYCLQVVVAHFYMKHWRYGPLEYILRVVTYLKLNPKKSAPIQDK